MLTLLCGGSIQSGFAASADAVSTLDNKQLKALAQQNQAQPEQESYKGEKVFPAILCGQISSRSPSYATIAIKLFLLSGHMDYPN